MGSASNSLPSYLPNHLSVTQKKKKRPKNKRERERREGPRQSKEKILVFFSCFSSPPSFLPDSAALFNKGKQKRSMWFSFLFCFEKKKESKRSTFSIRFQFVFFSLCFSRSIKIGNYVYYMESEKTMV